MRVVFFGPPGVGKGTQTKMVAEAMNWQILSMGDILREEIRTKSEIGIQTEDFLRRGNLVPDDIILAIVDDFIKENKENDIIFDGFPRNMNQAIAFHQTLSRQSTSLSYAFGFVLSHDDLLHRLSDRLYCLRCNNIYNMKTQVPKKPGVCDNCGGELIQREDDMSEVINERLRVYEEETKALVSYYSAQGIYRPIDARGSKEEVFGRIMEVLNAHNS